MKGQPSSAALPIAHPAPRILTVVNWLFGAGLIILLLVMPNEQWIMSAFKLSPSPETDRIILAMQAMAWMGLAPSR